MSPAGRPPVGVLAVQGDVREHVAALSALGAQVRTVRRPEDLEGLGGIVLPGGESTVMDRFVRMLGLQQPLRERIAGGWPVFGSCAGMIMLADHILDGTSDQQTIGGLDITVRRNAFGRQVDSFEGAVRMSGLRDPQRPMPGVFIRAPWVERVGEGVEILAVAAEHPVAVRQGRLLATSFHPEATDDRRVHELFLQIVDQTA